MPLVCGAKKEHFYDVYIRRISWNLHSMETISALVALWEGDTPTLSGFRHKSQYNKENDDGNGNKCILITNVV